MLAIILPLLLQERSLKQSSDKYNKLKLFNYWKMKNNSSSILEAPKVFGKILSVSDNEFRINQAK